MHRGGGEGREETKEKRRRSNSRKSHGRKETHRKRRDHKPLVLLVPEVDFVCQHSPADVINALSRLPPHEDILLPLPHHHY